MYIKLILGSIAALLAFLSAYFYIRDIFKGNTKPHTYTWLIWAIVTTIVFFGQISSGGGAGTWATGVSAILTAFILVLSLKGKYGTKDVTVFDKVCLVLAILSILPWLLTKNVLWSVLLATFIDLVAFFPTMRKTWYAPKSESLGSMYVDVVKHTLSTISMGRYSLVTLVYPLAVLATKFVIIGEMLFLRHFKKKPIKAICFDLDGVYFTPKGKNSFHHALTTEYGIQKEVVDELMYRSKEMAQLVRGQISTEDFWNRFREIAGITASDEELTERWLRDYEVDQDVKRTVLKAKACGYKTCVCTNNNAIRLSHLIQRFNLNDDFDVIVSSHEVGHTKPEREIFEALLDQLQVEPEELIYSDDNHKRIDGAREIGIKTFVFENFDQFMQRLKEFGVDLR